MEKSFSILVALKDHLQLKYSSLTSWTVSNDGSDVPPPIIHTDIVTQSSTLTVALKSSQKESHDGLLKTRGRRKATIKDFQDDGVGSTKDILLSASCPPRAGQTFSLVFCPVAIVAQEMSCRCLLSVCLVTYHGHLLKKDFMTLTIKFAIDESINQTDHRDENLDLAETTSSTCELLTKTDHRDENLDLAETTSSTCELLTKISDYETDGFSLCEGIYHKSHKSLQAQSIFIEPTPDGDIVVRSRACDFMLDLCEMYPQALSNSETNQFFLTCMRCRELDASLIGTTLPNEVADENLFNFELEEIKLERGLLDDHNENSGSEDVYEGEEPVTNLICVNCQKHFSFEQAFLKHMNICCQESASTTPEELACVQCGDEFTNQPDLMEHMELCKEGPAQFSCSNCQHEFMFEINLIKHLETCAIKKKKRKSSSVLPVKKKFAKKIKLEPTQRKKEVEEFELKNSELETKTREFDSACDICLRRFFHETTMKKHMEMHSERVPCLNEKTPCPVWGCELVCDNRCDLNVHFMSDHCQGDFSDKILCVYCLMPVIRNKIRDHIRMDHPHQKYICTECGRECLFPSQLKQHWKDMHNPYNSKDYVCEVCGNAYARSTGLKQHMLSQHSDEREFKCVHCGKGFTNATRLRQHVRIHTGAKPYKCKLCEYRSNRSDNVLFHLRKVHKVEKPTAQSDVQVIEEEL